MNTRTSILLFLFGAICVFSGCFPDIAGKTHVEEVKRLLAPDGKVEAVVQIVDGGATTSRAYCVFIVPKGMQTEEAYRMVAFDAPTDEQGKYGISTEWLSPTVLEVGAVKAKRVYEIRKEVQIGNVSYRVESKK